MESNLEEIISEESLDEEIILKANLDDDNNSRVDLDQEIISKPGLDEEIELKSENLKLNIENEYCENENNHSHEIQEAISCQLKKSESEGEIKSSGLTIDKSKPKWEVKTNNLIRAGFSDTSLNSRPLSKNNSSNKLGSRSSLNTNSSRYTLNSSSSSIGSKISLNKCSIRDIDIGALSTEQLKDFRALIMNAFEKSDTNGSGFIELSELRDALKTVGIDIPAYKVRDLGATLKQGDSNKDGKLSIDEFEKLYTKLKNENEARTFTTLIKPISDTKLISKETSNATHSIRNSEEIAFSKWINQNLGSDKDLNLGTNPITLGGKDLYTRCKDGLILCKLINFSVPNTIDERSINKGKNISIYQQLENLELALRSAEAIGCCVVNVRPKELYDADKEHLLLGLLWQIIQIGLFSDINLTAHPGLVLLLRDGETKEDLLKLTKEELLLRWVNYHLARSGYSGREVKNFSSDIKDSIAYTYLLKQIQPANYHPQVTLGPLNESNTLKRAELMLNEAEKLKAREFISPSDVVEGVSKLNMAFVANLFNTYPALDTPEETNPTDIIEETREEKTFRNWMNSVGVNPYVNYLYTDLQDSLIIFQLYDQIKPGSVAWNKVIQKFNPLSIKFQKLNNCNYAIELGKNPMNFVLVGIQGSNILNGDKMFTLALIWQLMRAYTLSLLEKLNKENNGSSAPINENSIIEWVNNKLKSAGKKTFIQSFQDPVISDSRVICDLIDAIKPSSIKYELLRDDKSYDAKLENARYAVSIARKIGARVYALPEDIVEVKQKMVMTIFAVLMIRELQILKEEK